TAIVTSATLATDGRFDFLAGRLGLTSSELEPVTGVFPSPFDYRAHALLAIPTDVPAPNRDAEPHAHAGVPLPEDLAAAADRGAVVITDPRVVTASYGQQLLRSLPPARRVIDPWEDLLPVLREFYASSLG